MYVGPEVSYNIHKPELASLRFRVFTGRSFETYPRNPRTRSGLLEKKHTKTAFTLTRTTNRAVSACIGATPQSTKGNVPCKHVPPLVLLCYLPELARSARAHPRTHASSVKPRSLHRPWTGVCTLSFQSLDCAAVGIQCHLSNDCEARGTSQTMRCIVGRQALN